MSFIPPFGLMFRAHALRQTSATVKLASRYYTGARHRAALTAIHNSEDRLVRRYWSGRLGIDGLLHGAQRLARLEQQLTPCHKRVASAGVRAAASPASTPRLIGPLRTIRMLQPPAPDGHALEQLQRQLISHNGYDRSMLAHDFWAGHVIGADTLEHYATELSRQELRTSPDRYAPGAERRRILDVIGFVAAQKPPSTPSEAYAAQEWSLSFVAASARQRELAPYMLLPERSAQFAALAEDAATALWNGCATDFDSLSSLVERTVASALHDVHAADETLKAIRCYLVFEVIAYIAQRQPPESTAHCDTWANHAERLERDAVQRLLESSPLPPRQRSASMFGLYGASLRRARTDTLPIADFGGHDDGSLGDSALESLASTLTTSGIGSHDDLPADPAQHGQHAAKEPVVFDAVNKGLIGFPAKRSDSLSSGISSIEGFYI